MTWSAASERISSESDLDGPGLVRLWSQRTVTDLPSGVVVRAPVSSFEFEGGFELPLTMACSGGGCVSAESTRDRPFHRPIEREP
jgi:hypothetical protein